MDMADQNAQVDIKGPRYMPRGENWTVAVLGASVRFARGHVLKITDNFSRKSPADRTWERKFAYYFGLPNADVSNVSGAYNRKIREGVKEVLSMIAAKE